MLFVSLVAPHFPLTAPPEHYYRYWRRDAADAEALRAVEERPAASLPARTPRSDPTYDGQFKDEADVQPRAGRLLGLVSFLDENIGKILARAARRRASRTTRG